MQGERREGRGGRGRKDGTEGCRLGREERLEKDRGEREVGKREVVKIRKGKGMRRGKGKE